MENDRLNRLAKIFDMPSFKCFSARVGILLGPDAFPNFMFEISSEISFLSVGKIKKLCIFGFFKYFLKLI